MIKKLLYSSYAKKAYEFSIRSFWGRRLITPLANYLSIGYLAETKKKLEDVSPSFCAAKWMQSTIHLEIGETHSCHHPARHKIEIDSLEKNPSRLHNTEVKAEARRQMVKGEFPDECQYCWKIEERGEFSDRIYKSSYDWAKVNFKELCTEEKINNVNPSYLEVSFSSDCNLKCAYCDPQISSAIRGEILKDGPYPTSESFQSVEPRTTGPEVYVNAFWKWWDEGLKEDLKVLRITGGEPLLSKDFFKLLDKLSAQNEKLDFDLAVNSNLMVSRESVEQVVRAGRELREQRKIKSFFLYTSIDTWGKQAEFLRYGLRLERFVKNIETALEVDPSLDLTFMVTYQALSPFNFNQLLEFILDLRKRHPLAKIKIGISVLHYPAFLSLQVMKKSHEDAILNNLNFMRENRLSKAIPHGFSNFEIQHLERNLRFFRESQQHSQIEQSDFISFVKEYERRKGLSFNETFSFPPEEIIR